MANLSVIINAEDSVPASLAWRKKVGSPTSIVSNLTRSATSESSELNYYSDEIDFDEILREFDFPISALTTIRKIPKSLTAIEFSDVKYLGTGSNSLVYTAIRNDEMVVIKMLKQKIFHRSIAEQEMSLEMHVLIKANHPNIIGIKGAGETPRKFIVVDYLEGGTLDQLLKKNQPQNPTHPHKKNGLPMASVLSIARDLASALKYLHDDMHPNATVIHRDLKPQNIGFTAERQLKLFDFGLVSCVQKRSSSDDAYAMSGFTGTLVYMAPEVALRQAYSEKVDVYSFGVLLWQMLSGEAPFAAMSREQYMERVVRGGQRPCLSAIAHLSLPEGLTRLMEQCWLSNPSLRPSCASIVLTLDAFIHNSSSSSSGIKSNKRQPRTLWSHGLGLFRRSSSSKVGIAPPVDINALYAGRMALKKNGDIRLLADLRPIVRLL